MGNLWECDVDLWETYGTLSCVPICLPICGKPIGNKPILLPSMGNLWHKKLILHLNLPIGFLQLRDFFATQKCSILVTHRFSMYAW